ncbi:MAG: sialidase family protein [Bacteroidota bacterium]
MGKYFLPAVFVFAGLLSLQFVNGQKAWVKEKEELIFTDAPFQQCHASTIVEIIDSSLMIACFGGSGEGNSDVKIWMKILEPEGWSAPYLMANGSIDNKTYPTWNPVLFESGSGKLSLYYKVGPNPREWWGMVKSITKESSTWKDEGRLPPGILGPIKNKPIQLSNGNIISPSSTETNDRWQVHVEISTDDGNSWTRHEVDSSSSYKVIQPTILQYPGNRLQMLCRSNQQKIVESWSDDGGYSWSKFKLTNVPNPNSGIDAVTLKDGSQMLVYNPTVAGNNWYDGRGILSVALSTDGKTWKRILNLEDGLREEYSYPAIIQAKDGKVHITYTYNRKDIKHVVLGRE